MAKAIRQAFEDLRSNLEITNLQASTVSTRQANLRTNLGKELNVSDDYQRGDVEVGVLLRPHPGQGG